MKRYTGKLLIGLASCLIIITACVRRDPKERAMAEGAFLAEKYCVSCHQLPAPGDLPRRAWLEILPKMGATMGLQTTMEENRYGYLLKDALAFPERPMMSDEEWALIKEYYTVSSEDNLYLEPTVIDPTPTNIFKAHKVQIEGFPPQTCLIKFGNDQDLYFGHVLDGRLNHYNIQTGELSQVEVFGAPSHLRVTDSALVVLSMGDFPPNSRLDGKVLTIQDGVLTDTIVGQLARSVHVSYADLNQDEREDMVVSGFGFINGSLDWFEDTGDNYKKHTLRPLPGAIKSEVMDVNEDGNADIIALMAQGDEGFFLYLGDGNGAFREQQLLSFPSTYGSSYFEMVDFNEDGKLDILYLNGDNGDYSKPVYKPYHGLRIYPTKSSKDSVQFEESFFFHLNGGFKAITHDYDLDGDLDIACISHFPDYSSTPDESFLLLENTGDSFLSFTARTIPEATDGKWLVMDAADYDQDGDIDLVLGSSPIMSLSDPVEFQSIWSKDPINFMILTNQTK